MSDTPQRTRRFYLRHLIAPVIILLLAGYIAYDVGDRFGTEQVSHFSHDSDHAVLVATAKLDNYRDLLYAGRAFVISSDTVTNTEWRTFYDQQDVFNRYPGVSSIAYIQNVPTAELKTTEAMLRSDEYFGPTYSLKQQSDRPTHGIARSYVSRSDLSNILGLDLFAQQNRYDVYHASETQNAVVASPPFKLATGYDGFFSVLAISRGGTTEGYVLTSFRFGDLMDKLFVDTSFGYRVTDITDTPRKIYENGYSTDVYHATHTIEVGGRKWSIDISRAAEKRPLGRFLPAVIVTTGILLAMSVYAFTVRPVRSKK